MKRVMVCRVVTVLISEGRLVLCGTRGGASAAAHFVIGNLSPKCEIKKEKKKKKIDFECFQ
jgi:hypothetical protein